MKIKNFPPDAKITFLGEIFKFHHLKSWNIKLGIKDNNEYMVKHSRLSNLPAFSRGRCLNPSDGLCRKGGYKFNFNLNSNEDWAVHLDIKSNTYYFNFRINRGKTASDIVSIRIPQIELARVLFFHNAYLSRNCIDQGILSREFDIQSTDDGTTVVNVLRHCTFPITQFNNEGIRRLLSWILLDSNAKEAYESIANNFRSEAKEFESYTNWHFNFKPPVLENISLETIGWLNSELNQYTVYEITAIHNLNTSLPQKIWFESPKFKSEKSSGSKGSSSGTSRLPEDPTVNDNLEADSNSRIVTVDVPKTALSFANAVETRKVVKKKSNGNAGGSDDIEIGYEVLDVGTGEATVNGQGAQGEFDALQDESDVLELYIQRFDAFKLLIKQFTLKHHIEYKEVVHLLQKVGRSRLHRTLDGNKRCLLEIQFNYKNQKYVMLEVDTSDNLKPLSTLIIQVNDLQGWADNFDNISKQIVKNSLRWPSIDSLQKYGTIKTLNHPKHLVELTESDNEFKGWLQRLEKQFNISDI